MTGIKILSISEQPVYNVKIEGLRRSDMQEFWVDLGDLYPRSIAVPFLLNSPKLPQPFTQSPLNPLQYAGPITHVQMKDIPNVWVVSVQWDTITNIQQTIKDPTKRPALISTGTYKQVDNPDTDFNGKVLATTAGEPIDFSYNRGYPTFTVEKCLATYPTIFAQYRDFVNNDNVTIYDVTYPPYTLFLPDVTISHLQWEGNYPFYDFNGTMYVSLKKDSAGKIIGWRNIKRNAGYHEKKIIGWQQKNKKKAFIGPVLQLNPGVNPPLNQVIANNQTIVVGSALSGQTQFTTPVQGGAIGAKYYPVYGLVAIVLGPKNRVSYPSSPVLINPKGVAFRQQLATDPPDGSNNTGEVLGLKAQGDSVVTSGISQEDWEAAVVEGRLFNFVSFNELLSFAINDPQTVPGGTLGAASL